MLKPRSSIRGRGRAVQVTNFLKGNMAKVEQPGADQGDLARAATLLQQFGYNERNLTANSVIVPVAHYLHPGCGRLSAPPRTPPTAPPSNGG